MRFANINGRMTLVNAGGLVDVATASDGRFDPDPRLALDRWPDLRAWAADQGNLAQPRNTIGTGGTTDCASACVGPPVPWPRQVFAIGLNYRDHVAESGVTDPDDPTVFTKFPSSLTGPRDSVALPPGSVDWEVELVVVIGRRSERVPEDSAWSHVAGVMVGQDLSERQLQMTGPAPQFSLGKSFPGFAPVGPEMVTIDELPDPDDLALGCRLEGGDILQRGRTRDLIFPVPELIARLSAVCPLLPGDLIFTGTPAGVGGARTPPQFLAAGDVLVSWIDGVGCLRNPMITAAAAARLSTSAGTSVVSKATT